MSEFRRNPSRDSVLGLQEFVRWRTERWGMSDHKQASRLLALSIAARERGDDLAADAFMKLAMESMERDERPVAQQQQQVQPKKQE